MVDLLFFGVDGYGHITNTDGLISERLPAARGTHGSNKDELEPLQTKREEDCWRGRLHVEELETGNGKPRPET